jgi:hypothetical protein
MRKVCLLIFFLGLFKRYCKWADQKFQVSILAGIDHVLGYGRESAP